MTDYEKIWYSDYGDIWLKRVWNRIMLKRYTPLEYQYMEDHIRDNHDIRWEWQDDVWNWNTEEWYDDWLQNYEYPYEDYFCYDSDTEEYYDEDDNDTMRDYFYTDTYTKEQVIENVIDQFEENYQDWNFEWATNIDDRRLRELVWQYYDCCKTYEKEREEANKPHWNVFNYYK